MESILRWGVYTGLFAVLFIPFLVFDNLFFPFITSKGFAFRFIVEAIFVMWAVLALSKVGYRPRFSTLMGVGAAFLGTLLISVFLSQNPEKSFWSNFERMEGWILMAHLGAYFTVLVSMFRTEKLWKYFFNTSIGVSIALGLYGLLQIAGYLTINQGGVRVDATFGNATYLAVYMLFHVFLTLLAFVKWSPSRLMQFFYGVALLLQVSMIFFAATRGTTLGLLGGLLLSGLLFTLFAKGQKQLRRAGIGILAGIVLLVGGFLAIKDTAFIQEHPVFSRFANISLSEAETRFTIWSMALEGGMERPLFGWGQESFNYIFAKYYDPSLYAQEPWFDRAHNAYLDWFVAGGFPALILYLTLFVIALWYLWRPGSPFQIGEQALLTGVLAGYGFHNLFVFDNLMSYVMLLTVFGYILYRHTDTFSAPETHRIPTLSRENHRLIAGGVALAMFVGLFSVINAPGIARATYLIQALVPQDAGIEENVRYFERATTGDGLGSQEAHEQFGQFAVQVQGGAAQGIPPALLTTITEKATAAFEGEVARYPEDPRLQLFLGVLYRAQGMHDEAEAAFLAARTLSPEKQSILFELGFNELVRGNAEDALPYFEEAYNLAPAYDQARLYLAAAYIRAGEKESAQALLEERYGTALVNDDSIVQAYLVTGDIAAVVSIMEARAEASPQDFNAWLDLASAYYEAGRLSDTVEALREAARLNPEIAGEVEATIQQIGG